MCKENAIIQNLQDAGCHSDMIDDFIQSYRANRTPEQMRVLSNQRKFLLNLIHEGQKKLDCLDYLIYEIRKEQSSDAL